MTLHSNIKLIPKSINFVGLNCFFLLRLFPRIFSVSKFLVSFGEMTSKKIFSKIFPEVLEKIWKFENNVLSNACVYACGSSNISNRPQSQLSVQTSQDSCPLGPYGRVLPQATSFCKLYGIIATTSLDSGNFGICDHTQSIMNLGGSVCTGRA